MKLDDSKDGKEIVIPVSGPESSDESLNEAAEPEILETTLDEAAAVMDQLQRLQAEFKNYRRRIDAERKSLFSLAKSELVLKLLPVLDDFERMIAHQDGDCELNLDGVNLILQNFRKALVDEGLKIIPAVGEVFNPEVHEAVSVEETGEDQDGMVVDEWQKGYRFGDRMLRPSRVKVGKTADRTDGV